MILAIDAITPLLPLISDIGLPLIAIIDDIIDYIIDYYYCH
jgi:hypothetical protein